MTCASGYQVSGNSCYSGISCDRYSGWTGTKDTTVGSATCTTCSSGYQISGANCYHGITYGSSGWTADTSMTCSASNDCSAYCEWGGPIYQCHRSNAGSFSWTLQDTLPSESACTDGYDNNCDNNIDMYDTNCYSSANDLSQDQCTFCTVSSTSVTVGQSVTITLNHLSGSTSGTCTLFNDDGDTSTNGCGTWGWTTSYSLPGSYTPYITKSGSRTIYCPSVTVSALPNGALCDSDAQCASNKKPALSCMRACYHSAET
jgi:hypothetical protein